MRVTLAALLLAASLPVLAHHSFAAEYDSAKPATIKGKFIGIDWTNPHAVLHLAAASATGKMEEWKCEMPPPNRLNNTGLRKDMLKPGDEIAVFGYPAKDGSRTLWSESVTFPNGSKFQVRPPR